MTSSLAVGNHTISAVYSGDSLDATSTGLLQDFATASLVATSGLFLYAPDSVAVDSQGDLFIADGDNRIVEVNAAGTASTVNTPGLSEKSPDSVAVDSHGDLFIADSYNNRIVEVNAAGTASFPTPGLSLNNPYGVAVDAQGDLFIADYGNSRVVEVNAAGTASVVNTPGLSLFGPRGVAVDAQGDLFIADTGHNRIVEVNAAGTASVLPTPGLSLNNPEGVAVDSQGDLFIADTGHNRIVEVNAAGTASVLPTPGLSLSFPTGVAVDAQGDLFIADTFKNRIVEVQASLPVTRASQTIDFTAPTSPLAFVANETVNLSTSGGASGNPVIFSIDSSSTGKGSISGSTLTVTGAGTFIIDANQAGDSNYMAATQVQQTLVVNPANQTITFTAPTSPITFAPNETVNLSASASSGDQVAFSIDSSSTGTGSISGSTLTVTGAGTFIIDANQAGDSNYNAATQVQQTLVVNKASQTISFPPPTSPIAFVPNETVNLSATGGASGNPVVFSIDSISTGTGSISGSTLTATSAGILLIDANQAGDSDYDAATQVQQLLVVQQASQTINFAAPTSPITFVPNETVNLNASASSGDQVAFSIDASSSGTGSISGSTLTVTGAGTFIIDANQAGDNNYNAAAQVQVQVTVGQATPTITVSPVSISYGTALANSQLSGSASFTVNGQPVSVPGSFAFTSTAGTILHASGTAYSEGVTFTPTDSTDYTTATTTVQVTVGQATPTITVSPVSITYGTALANSQLSGTASYTVNGVLTSVSGTFSYTSAAGTILNASGTAYSENVTFTPTDSADYTTATARVQITVLGPGSIRVIGTQLYLVGGNKTNDRVNIKPIGSSTTGSTGIQVNGQLNDTNFNNVQYTQAFAAIHIIGFAGNENFQVANTLTIPLVISAGNGNDKIQVGNGNNTISLGNGNDKIHTGNGNNTVTAGNGNNTITLGNGNNAITLGNGNDNVQVGNGTNVVVTGNGNDKIQAGNGNNLIAAGLGKHNVQVGNGSNILIDGSVQLTQSGDSLRQVLDDWIDYGTQAANVASIRARLNVTYNTSYANTLDAGNGVDWFWESYGKDRTNRRATDLLN